jgi:hypothetical protein
MISIFPPYAYGHFMYLVNPIEHEFYSSFDICHPGSIWVALSNLQDNHIMISIFCPNGHF